MNDPTSLKPRLRLIGRERRRRLSRQALRRAAVEIAGWAGVIAMLAQRQTVSTFSTFGDELDTAPLTAALLRVGCRLALPVVTGKGRPLTFRRWRPGDPMGTGPFGIRQPLDTAPEEAPGLLLVPLLAFDRRGFRVGYGGGFYDRTLAAARAERRIVAIGLGFACQEVARVPTDRYDQPVDMILTEAGLVQSIGRYRATAVSR